VLERVVKLTTAVWGYELFMSEVTWSLRRFLVGLKPCFGWGDCVGLKERASGSGVLVNGFYPHRLENPGVKSFVDIFSPLFS